MEKVGFLKRTTSNNSSLFRAVISTRKVLVVSSVLLVLLFHCLSQASRESSTYRAANWSDFKRAGHVRGRRGFLPWSARPTDKAPSSGTNATWTGNVAAGRKEGKSKAGFAIPCSV